ncbi:YonJ-like protein [environmental Halophage eHP-18]|nr:YonJ-like protein [environmental Halophage eHP-18]
MSLTDRQKTVLSIFQTPAKTRYVADTLGISRSAVNNHMSNLRDAGVSFRRDPDSGRWVVESIPEGLLDTDTTGEDTEPEQTPEQHTSDYNNPDNNSPDTTPDTADTDLPDLSGVEQGDDPDESELSDRQRLIATELQSGATVDELAEELEERRPVVTEHIRDLKRQGWNVYIDESAEHVGIEGDQPLRSSEHTGTRTRKANKWWTQRHNALVREFRNLSTPSASLSGDSGNEDWITHLTDIHAGDIVRDDAGNVIYETDEIPAVIDYVTQQAIDLAAKHNSTYDTGHLLWGGDMVTNEGIYEGQFEDLDAWLDEQHETLINPLIRQIKAFAERFETVNVVTQVGNHGQNRASGTSRQANADLILYKTIRNTVAQIRDHTDELQNVNFQIGEARPYKNFDLRGGELTGHLRHGQHRRPQAETSARKKEWLNTLLDHDFDVGYMGHYHISGRIPWDGPPILASPSPKPAGEFVEKIGGRTPGGYQGVATCHGVSDDGITGVFPIDTRHYSR